MFRFLCMLFLNVCISQKSTYLKQRRLFVLIGLSKLDSLLILVQRKLCLFIARGLCTKYVDFIMFRNISYAFKLFIEANDK